MATNKFEHLTGTNNWSIMDMVNNYISKTLTMFLYTGLPKSLPAKELEYILQTKGKCFVMELDGEIVALDYNTTGDKLDVYGNNLEGQIYLPHKKEWIDVNLKNDGVVVENDFLGRGLKTIIENYCELIKECETTLSIANFWKRTEKVFIANDDKMNESLLKYLTNIKDGNIKPVTTNLFTESLKIENLPSNTQSFRELIDYHKYLKSELYNEIGLFANDNMKRERLISSEVETGFNTIYPFVDNMINSRRNAIEEINEKYDLNIEVEFTSSWEYRLNLGENITEEEIENVDDPKEDDKEVGEEINED